MFSNMTIRRKLALLSATFVLPVAFLLYQLMSQSLAEMEISAREVQGNRYVMAMKGTVEALVKERHGIGPADQSAAQLRQAMDAVDMLDKQIGAGMQTSKLAGATFSDVRDYLSSNQRTRAESYADTLQGLRDLIQRAGDGSAMIFDREIGSYYTVELSVLRLPELMQRLSALTLVVDEISAAEQFTPAMKTRYLLSKGELTSSLNATALALESAMRGSEDGSLEISYSGPFARANLAVRKVLQTMDLMVLKAEQGMMYEGTEVAPVAGLHADAQEALGGLWAVAGTELDRMLAERLAKARQNLMMLLAASLGVVAAAMAMAWWIANSISRPLGELNGLMLGLSEGDVSITVPYGHRRDEVGAMAGALEVFRQTAVRAIRSQTALDSVSTGAMLVDNDGVVLELNSALSRHFTAHADDLAEGIDGFTPDSVKGRHIGELLAIDGLETILTHLKDGWHERLPIGGRIFDLTANPVINQMGGRGDRLGTVIEWADVTEQLATEDEVAELVDAAAAGDFTRRLSTGGKTGFMERLSEALNRVVELVDQSLEDLLAVTSALAEGDLTQRIDRDYEGAFQRLKEDANLMGDRLTRIVTNIHEAAYTTKTAAGEISQGSEDLAARTEQQAANLEETAAAMEQLTATVRQNSDNAQAASKLAATARASAEAGGEVIGPATDAMERIEESSEKIAEIIGVIEEIAFQTNLLALNASVEAARAGDAGKGFAVVASEVRSLAQRSSQASKEIRELIIRSGNQVKHGVRLVRDVGEQLDEIIGSVKQVADIVAEIAAASREQTTGLDEMNAAVFQLEEMTQKNAALAEETTAATQSLAMQAEELVRLVSFFHTGEDGVPDQLDRAPEPIRLEERPRRAAPPPPPEIETQYHRRARLTPSAERKAPPRLPPRRPPAEELEDDWAEF